MKKLIIIFALFIGIAIPIRANAATGDTFGCLNVYYNYISTAVSEKSRGEIFKDFTRSYCQVNDIIEINDELETLRDTFRSAAESCQNTTEYQKTYTKLLMEQYFIRNIQKVPSDVIDDSEVDEIKAEKQRKLDLLESDMKEIFVLDESKVTEEDFDTYYAEWSSKYDDSIIKYAHCDEGPWAELTTTWNDFIEKMKSIKVKPEKVEYVPPTGKHWAPSISKNIVEFFKKFKEKRLAKIEPKKTVSEAVAGGASYTDIIGALGDSEQTFNTEVDSATRMAKYQVLYAEGGAKVSSNFQTVIHDLNSIITDSNNVELMNIKKRVDQVKEKQCK